MRKTKYIKDVMGNCGYNMDSNITLINLDSDGYIYFIDNNTNTYYKAIYTSSTPIMIDSDTSTLTFDGSKYLAGVSAYTFTYVVTNEDNIDVTGEITFSSNDENIVTVTNNVITAVGSGTTTISLVHEDYDPITDPGASGLSYITVGPYVDALLHNAVYILTGETFYATDWTNSLGQAIPVSQLGDSTNWDYNDTYLDWADTEGGFTAKSLTGSSTITATDPITQIDGTFIVLITDPLSITTASPLGTVNFGELMTPIQLTTEGETGTVTFAVHMGDTIPSGLTLSSTGLISGTPAVSGNTQFFIVATDDLGSCEKQFTLFIAKVVSSVVDLVAVGDNMNYVTAIDNSLHTITFDAAAGTLQINTFYSIILTDDGGLGSIEYLDMMGGVLTGTDTINSVISLFVTAEDGVTTQSYPKH